MPACFGPFDLLLYYCKLRRQGIDHKLLSETLWLQVGECVSVLLAGFALDDWGVTIRQLCLILAGVAATMTLAWLPLAVVRFGQYKRNAIKPAAEIWQTQFLPLGRILPGLQMLPFCEVTLTPCKFDLSALQYYVYLTMHVKQGLLLANFHLLGLFPSYHQCCSSILHICIIILWALFTLQRHALCMFKQIQLWCILLTEDQASSAFVLSSAARADSELAFGL